MNHGTSGNNSFHIESSWLLNGLERYFTTATKKEEPLLQAVLFPKEACGSSFIGFDEKISLRAQSYRFV